MLKPKSSTLQIRIEPELVTRLKRICDAQGVPVSFMLRNAINNLCDNYDQRIAQQKAFHQRQAAKS